MNKYTCGTCENNGDNVKCNKYIHNDSLYNYYQYDAKGVTDELRNALEKYMDACCPELVIEFELPDEIDSYIDLNEIRIPIHRSAVDDLIVKEDEIRISFVENK